MARTIFYSWQNDLDSKTHRYFIEKCLKRALSNLEKDGAIYMNYDRDTKGINGSPDITTTIFDKIDKSVLFVCDISIINSNAKGRKTPNPNVLVELGYAAKLFMYPHQFSEPFSLSIGCEKYSRQLIFKRVPYESVNIAAFESQSEQPLMVKYLVDEDERRIDFNISFNLSYANTVRDIVESTSIYNAFAEGKGLFGGKPLITDIDVSKVKKYDPESLLFWEKVLIIEERLNVGFEPPQDDVDFKTICLMETLYQNLIKGVPIRENKKIDVFKGEQGNRDNDQIKTSVGESVFFEFQSSTHISLLGVEIDLLCVVAICDSKITNYTVEDKKYKLSLDHLSEDKHMYTSTLLFENEEALLAYMNGSRDERIAALCNAKTVQEYLTDQQTNK